MRHRDSIHFFLNFITTLMFFVFEQPYPVRFPELLPLHARTATL